MPLQFDDVELLFAALTPFEQGLATLRGTPLPTTCPAGVPAASTLTHCGQLGGFGLNSTVQGWDVYDTYQVQFTATQTFTNVLKAAQMVVVAEAGLTHVEDMPDKLTGGPNGRGLRFNGPATNVSGNYELRGRHCPTLPAAQCLALDLVEPQNRFADATSYGYRIAGPSRIPRSRWVPGTWCRASSGSTTSRARRPDPAATSSRAVTASRSVSPRTLQAKWEVDMSWTKFGGAGRWNDINDRDYVAATLKFSF